MRRGEAEQSREKRGGRQGGGRGGGGRREERQEGEREEGEREGEHMISILESQELDLFLLHWGPWRV